jgi:protein-tyrosine-phosphatase/DNA-binding transcriptional ArsR family regulator
MDVEHRAELHRALGDEIRLRIVDDLVYGDRTPGELADMLDLPSNLLAHHLGVLEECRLITRHRSEGDARKRYLTLERGALRELGLGGRLAPVRSVLFICTHNSARSKFAEAVFRDSSEMLVESAGTEPARRVHPKARAVAARMGVDIGTARPRSYGDVGFQPDLVVSLCDLAREAPTPFDAPRLHWSIPDPVPVGRVEAFRVAFEQIRDRVGMLAEMTKGGTR